MSIPGLFIWEFPQGEVAWPRCSLKTWYKMVLSCCLFLAWVRHLSLLVALSNQEMVTVKGSNTISNIASLISSQWNYHNFTHVQLQLFPRLEILEKRKKQNKKTQNSLYTLWLLKLIFIDSVSVSCFLDYWSPQCIYARQIIWRVSRSVSICYCAHVSNTGISKIELLI